MAAPPPNDSTTAVSEAVSRLFLDKFGKGPMHIKTFAHGDVMTTLMRDVFTTAERSMVAAGRSDSVVAARVQWQLATNAVFKEAVSVAAGREVRFVVSGFEVEGELATEVFVLAPA